jgi:hypothetical protein
MNTRRAVPADRDVLFDIWLRSVRATHDFVSPEDIQSIIPLVKDYLASSEPEFWVVSSDDGAVMGFMGDPRVVPIRPIQGRLRRRRGRPHIDRRAVESVLDSRLHDPRLHRIDGRRHCDSEGAPDGRASAYFRSGVAVFSHPRSWPSCVPQRKLLEC